ncbi:MAG: ATP-binding protein [Spirochaetota bacterium]
MIYRNITSHLITALSDTPVVFLQGARQTGKSTLVQYIAEHDYPALYFTLDDAAVFLAARQDPQGFIESLSTPVIIDEVQRVPDLILAIKKRIDKNRKPGQFILTGSAQVLVLPKIAESLAGRMEVLTLWPFSRGEITGIRETFIDRIFESEIEQKRIPLFSEKELHTILLTGGFPEIFKRKTIERRNAWFGSFITAIIQRDIRDISRIEGIADLPKLLSLIAARSGKLVNFSDLSADTALPQTTLKRYMALLAASFLSIQIYPWFTNISKRFVKTPKIYICDTGIMSYLLSITEQRLSMDTSLAGQFLETFIIMELIKQKAWSVVKPAIYHYRTHNQKEVDIILEDASKRIVGLEVKHSVSLKVKDLEGLKDLSSALGKRFKCGLIFYRGDTILPFGNNLYALPIEYLWR